MYFKSRINGKPKLQWFDARTDWEKSSDKYFENLDELAQRLDGLDNELDLDTSMTPEDFDSGYEYVYGRIKELKESIEQKESADELDSVNLREIMDDLHDIYEELLDLYDPALLYDDYYGDDPDDYEDALDIEDSDDDGDSDDGRDRDFYTL